jgi:hypothetical protein
MAASVIQVTPQMRVLVAVDAADFRRGIGEKRPLPTMGGGNGRAHRFRVR